jgi:hypothetical protein
MGKQYVPYFFRLQQQYRVRNPYFNSCAESVADYPAWFRVARGFSATDRRQACSCCGMFSKKVMYFSTRPYLLLLLLGSQGRQTVASAGIRHTSTSACHNCVMISCAAPEAALVQNRSMPARLPADSRLAPASLRRSSRAIAADGSMMATIGPTNSRMSGAMNG